MTKDVFKLGAREKPGSRVAELRQNPKKQEIAAARKGARGRYLKVSGNLYGVLVGAGKVMDLGGTSGAVIRLGSLQTDAARINQDLSRIGDDFRVVLSRDLKRLSHKK